MGEYGVTKNGFVLKRFDAVYESLAEKVKDYAGIDIDKKSDSVLNLAIFYPVADLIARLHEESLDVYNSLHPSTAEGVALDDACQYANIRRKAAKKTVYQISCNMTDGNTLLAGTIIAADTNPRHDLYCDSDTVVSREACSLPEETHRLVLSESLTTASVTGLVKFSTGEYGSIIMPDRAINQIISNKSTGFNWCENRIAPVAGRLAAEDYEFRQDYIAQIYSHSSNMVDSIRSYLLANVDGVETVNVYENTGDTVDEEGRLPHSIEVIVEGGTDSAVAYGILSCRPGGIQTNGEVSIDCDGENGESINIRFNRPSSIYAWISVSLSGDVKAVPSNYKRIITDLMMDNYGTLTAGQTLYIQALISEIYKKVPGLTRVVITQANTTSSSTVPGDSDYKDENIQAKKREKIVVAENRIKVVLTGL